jgi:hypothetical protein
MIGPNVNNIELIVVETVIFDIKEFNNLIIYLSIIIKLKQKRE